jgi:acyl dehydratase
MREITGIEDLKAAEGETLGTSDWHEVTQADINTFADVTGDHQWIHVDPERAKETPFGGTIAHGFYTVSLIPKFAYDLFTVEGIAFALNYGLNKVRFPAPLKVGSKVRMRATLSAADDIPGGVQMVTTNTFEVEGGEKPVCVAESVTRMFAG